MFSSFIKVLFPLIGLSPILVSLYVVNIFKLFPGLSFYIRLSNFSDFLQGIKIIVSIHYLLILFMFSVAIAKILMAKAITNLPIGRIDVKSIKPVDSNFLTILFSIVLPFAKLKFADLSDLTFLLCFFFVVIVHCVISHKVSHFNLILRFFLGYKNYEVQTTREVTYLVLSQSNLINKTQLTEYISLTDFMIVNVTKKKND